LNDKLPQTNFVHDEPMETIRDQVDLLNANKTKGGGKRPQLTWYGTIPHEGSDSMQNLAVWHPGKNAMW
jgi:hypothetical protein